MANLLGESQEPQLQDDDFASLEDELKVEPQKDPEEGQPSSGDEVPDKYKGKSATDLIRMHQEAEKLAGRQGNEVGELRKLVDDFIVNQSTPKQDTQQVTISDVDFIENPNDSVDKKIDSHPAVKAAREATNKLSKMEAQQAIFTAHPDAMDIVNDTEFRSWVEKSQARVAKLKKADSEFDFNSADDLFTTWKERQELVSQAKEHANKEREQAIKSGSNGGARGSGEGSKKKFLKRTEILHMMQYEPERYLANSDAISKAYAENRVR
jgi:hypothetical protein